MKALVINCSPVRTGATAEIVRIVRDRLAERFDAVSVCIDDYHFGFCKGCRSCHTTAACVQDDDVIRLIDEFSEADVIVCVSPSYWADIPGQFKAFIDRCTPWCNTHEPHRTIPPGKKGYAIALRTGPGMKECERIMDSIEHFYGHLEIKCSGRLGLCAVEYREAVAGRRTEIEAFCETILHGERRV
ncbi:MAG: flavodoxin family protein [Lachnospiraceae bacterium]|nr:flavodoxin family protein [Lachnospiraceae bacterium]